MSQPRLYHAAALLPNGDVLEIGGGNDRGDVLASADLCVPSQNRWYPPPAL
jgi:hypothetical protein